MAHAVLAGPRSAGAAMSADEEIRAASVLPAVRRDIELLTDDGLRLVGEIALPAGRPAKATLLCMHPLPTHGGMMDSHLLRKASWRLPALADIAVLRFNSRGTSSARGTSEGSFDASEGEGLDLRAATDWVREQGLPRPWLLGWSFGSDVVLRHGAALDPAGIIAVSPPLRFTGDDELRRWNDLECPIVCLVPENDDYLRPDEARQRFAVIPRAVIVEGASAGHLWVGETQVRAVLDEVAELLVPGSSPLPTVWSAERARDEGPMERWSDL